MECGVAFGVSDYADELTPEMWDRIALRPANRA